MTQKFSGHSLLTVRKPDTQPGSLSEMGMIKRQTKKPGGSTRRYNY